MQTVNVVVLLIAANSEASSQDSKDDDDDDDEEEEEAADEVADGNSSVNGQYYSTYYFWSKCCTLCWPDCKPEGPLFSAEFVCLCVCWQVMRVTQFNYLSHTSQTLQMTGQRAGMSCVQHSSATCHICCRWQDSALAHSACNPVQLLVTHVTDDSRAHWHVMRATPFNYCPAELSTSFFPSYGCW